MIRHTVMWKLHPQAEGQDRAANARRIKGLLEGLIALVPEIKFLEVGINCLADENNHDVILNCEFADLAALERYQKHPEHLKVVGLIAPLRSARSAIDQEI